MPLNGLRAICLAAAMLSASAAVADNDYPKRPVTILNGFAPGGAVDVVARAVAAELAKSLGQTFIVESRPGAGSNIAARAAATSAPDGYTLLLGTNGVAINMTLYKFPGFDVEKDLAPISLVGDIPSVIAANPSFPANNIPELIAYAKQKPNEAVYGTPGNGSLPHLAMVLFEQTGNIQFRHAPYRGGNPAVTDAIAGHIPLVVVNALEATPQITAGRLKALGVTGTERLAGLPNVATIAETKGYAGYHAATWWGLFAPAGTPPAILDKLEKATHQALATPTLKKLIEGFGGQVKPLSRTAFTAFVKEEREKWGKVVAQTGLHIE
jgi:tripartite-type tricarboxylate transporter receptor subunit TctC